MPTTVDIPELGTVEFPDSMSEQDISAEVGKLTSQRAAPSLSRYASDESRGGYMTEVARGLTQFVPALTKTTSTVGDKLGNLVRRGVGLEPLPLEPPEERPLYKAGQWMQDKLDAAYPAVPEPQRNLGHDVSTGLGQMASMVAGGVAARGAGATLKGAALVGTALGFSQEFDDAFARARQRGDDPDTALWKSLGYASLAAMIENKLGAGRIIKKYFPDPSEAARKLSAWGISKAVGTSLAVGFGEEGSQRFAQNWIVEGKPSLEGVVQEGAPGGIVQAIAELPATLLRAQGGRVRRQPRIQTNEDTAVIQPRFTPQGGLSRFAPVKEDPNVKDRESSSMEVSAGQPAKSVSPDAAGVAGEIQKPAAAIPQGERVAATEVAAPVAPLTPAEQNEFENLTIMNRAAQQRGFALSPESFRRYQELAALAQRPVATETGIADELNQLRAIANPTTEQLARISQIEAQDKGKVQRAEWQQQMRAEMEARKAASPNAPIKDTGAAAVPPTDVSGEPTAAVKPAEGNAMLWDEQPERKNQTALSSSGDYVISHRPNLFTLSYRPKGQHNPIGKFSTLAEAKSAAENYVSVGTPDVKPVAKPMPPTWQTRFPTPPNRLSESFSGEVSQQALKQQYDAGVKYAVKAYDDMSDKSHVGGEWNKLLSSFGDKRNRLLKLRVRSGYYQSVGDAKNAAFWKGANDLLEARTPSEADLDVRSNAPTPATPVAETKPSATSGVGEKGDLFQQLSETGMAESEPRGTAVREAWVRAVEAGRSGTLPSDQLVKGINEAEITFNPKSGSMTIDVSGHATDRGVGSDLGIKHETVTVTVTEDGALRAFSTGGREPRLLKFALDKAEALLTGKTPFKRVSPKELPPAALAQKPTAPASDVSVEAAVKHYGGLDKAIAALEKERGDYNLSNRSIAKLDTLLAKLKAAPAPASDVSPKQSETKPITIDAALNLAEQRKAEGKSQLSVTRELGEAGLSDGDATGVAAQVFAAKPAEIPASDLFPDLKGKAPTLERVRNAIVESEADLEAKFEAATDENIRSDNPIHAEVDLAQRRVDKLRALGQRLERSAIPKPERTAEPKSATPTRTTPAVGTPERAALESEWEKWNAQLSAKIKEIGTVKEKKERTGRYTKAYDALQARYDKLNEQYYAIEQSSKAVREQIRKSYQEDHRESVNPIESAKAASELGDRTAYDKAKQLFLAEAKRQEFTDEQAAQMFMDAWSYSIREEVGLPELVKKRGDMLRADANAADFKESVKKLSNLTDSERRSADYAADNDRYRPEKLTSELDRLRGLDAERSKARDVEIKKKADSATQQSLELSKRIVGTTTEEWNQFVRDETKQIYTTKKLAQEHLDKRPAEERGDMQLYRYESGGKPTWVIWYTEAAGKRRAEQFIAKHESPPPPATSGGSASLAESTEANIAERAIAGIEDLQKKLRGSGADVSMGVPKAILDLALEVARLSLKAGNTIYQAIDAAIAKIREQIGDTPFDESQVRASLNLELAPGQPTGDARAREEDGEKAITQVQSVKVGVAREVENIAAIQQTIRSDIFDGTQSVSASATAQARELFMRLTDPAGKAAAAGDILTKTNAQMGPGLVLAELWRYAERTVLATGDDSFLRQIVPHYQDFPLGESGAGSTAFGRGLRALQETDTLFKQLYEIEKGKRTAAGEQMSVGPELLEALLAGLKGEVPDATVLERKTRTVLGTKVPQNKVEEIVRVVRTNTVDPITALVDHFSKMAGFPAVTPEQHERLIKLAQQLSDPNLSIPEKSELIDQMFEVFNRLKLPPSLLTRLAANLVATNLTGFKTLGINIFSPNVQGLVELGLAGITSPMDFPAMLKGAIDGGKQWLANIRYSMGRDAYSFLNNDYQAAQNVLKQLWQRGLQQIKSNSWSERSRGLANLIFGSQQYYMRLLNAVDNANGILRRQMQMSLYSSQAMRRLGMSAQEIRDVTDMFYLMRDQFYAQAVESGLTENQSRIRADALAYQEFVDFLNNELPADSAGRPVGSEMAKAAHHEAMSVLGRLSEGVNEIDEGGLVKRTVGAPILYLSNWMRQQEGLMPAIGVSLLGYVNVPYRTASYYAWNTPYGLVRLGIHKWRKSKKKESWWKQSLATEFQEQQRLKNALAGSAVLAALTGIGIGLLNTSAGDDAGDDDDNGVYFTGNGPKNKNLRSAWIAKGFRPQSLVVFVGGKPAVMELSRSGESLAHYAWLLAARDDRAWREKEAKATNREYTPTPSKEAAYAIGTYLGLLGQRGFLQTVTQAGNVASGQADPLAFAASKGGSFVSGLFTPGLGLQRSVQGLLHGPVDTSSVQSAFLANFPMLSITGINHPKVNAFGDSLYNPENSWYHKMKETGIPIAFSTSPTTENKQLYGLLVEKGVAPRELRRSTVENKYGPLTDEEFAQFAQKSGKLLKEQTVNNLPMLQNMTPEGVKKWLNSATASADRVTAMGMNLEPVKPKSAGVGGSSPNAAGASAERAGAASLPAAAIGAIAPRRTGLARLAASRVGGRSRIARPRFASLRGLGRPTRRRRSIVGRLGRVRRPRGLSMRGLRRPRMPRPRRSRRRLTTFV